jgi:hypothetical protein
MTTYRVKFFKDLLSSDGHPFKCLQKVVDIRHSKSPERAVKAAKHRFRRSEHLSDWKLHANSLETEVEYVGAKRQGARSAPRRRKKSS